MFGSLNICVPFIEYSTFCRDRWKTVRPMIFFLKSSFQWKVRNLSLPFSIKSHLPSKRKFNILSSVITWCQQPLEEVVDSYFQYTACGFCYSLDGKSDGSPHSTFRGWVISGCPFFCRFADNRGILTLLSNSIEMRKKTEKRARNKEERIGKNYCLCILHCYLYTQIERISSSNRQ